MAQQPSCTHARRAGARLAPALVRPLAGGRVRAPGRPARVRRAPAVAALDAPPIAVWAGEVLLLAAATPGRALAVALALRGAAPARVRVALVRPGDGCDVLRAARALSAALVEPRSPVAVVAVLDHRGTRAARAGEALQRAVARAIPCRRVWLGPRLLAAFGGE
jgi:hypothetical protein